LASFFFFQAEDGIRDPLVTGVQTCALPICLGVMITVGPHPPLHPEVIMTPRPDPQTARVRPGCYLARYTPVLLPTEGTTGLNYEIGRASCRERAQTYAVARR